MSHFKDINGSSAIIYNSVFEGETQFQNMTMVGATIAEARFEGGTIFNDIPMQGITIFKTIFEGDTVFIHSSMKGTRISETRFEGGIDFQQTDLTGVVVKNCIFEGGFLGSNIDLKQAQIVDSVFEGDSLFDQARMSLCNISKTVFAEGSSFIEADIRAASFAKVELQSASFRGADLSWSHLFDINLDRGDISDAKLSSATLEKVSLVSANLTGVDLSRARLIDVNLRGAKLQDANLLNVNLDSVVLLGVDLTEFGYLMLSKNFVANQFRFGWELLSDDLKMKQDFADTFWQLAKLSSEGKNLDIEKTQQIINVLDEGLEIVIEILYPILTQQSYKIILDSSSHPTNISIVYDDTILRVNEAKADLQQLIAQLNLVAHQVPPNNTEEAEVIAELAQTLIETASSDRPNKTMMKIMGEGLKQAAKNLAEIVPNIVQIVDNIVTATLSMVQEHKYIAWHPELQQLVAQLNMVLQQVPPNNTEEAEVIAELAQTLIETASSDRPNKTMMKIMGEGLKQAAKNLAEIVPNIVQIVDNIVTATLVLG
ncbi:pentapeptide repeat-containing protein [Candidatus Leptofilum sp.]|uniref:pentapeptide repeat-containing protein n=1 Tax=Candidatus Leptofilum sp. TaxID=3241576 RepID=UPI003B5A8606